MRSVPTDSFQRLSEPLALWQAWLQCRKGKRRQPRIATFDLDVDNVIFHLHRTLQQGCYHPKPHTLKVIHDPKTRLVAAPSLEDRIVQTALLNEISPSYERSFIDQSYACLTGRGPQRAVLAYLSAVRHYRYRLSLDIRHYFASIDHSILYALLAHRLQDPRTLQLLDQLITTGGEVYQTTVAQKVLGHSTPSGCGMPLGSYLSHWSGALYLDGLDHYVKRVLKIKAYQRYMDDFSLFHDQRSVLEAACDSIQTWLKTERQLTLKGHQQIIKSTREASTFLGFRVSPAGISPGPKSKRRLKQRLRHQDALTADQLMRSLQAYKGIMLSIG